MFKSIDSVKVHFIGIGGIGMSAIAEVLLQLGFKVSGSDIQESANTKKLESLGAEVYYGHDVSNLKDSTVVVYTSAIENKNVELLEAEKRQLPTMRRAEMLAELMMLKQGISIAGTHGKTTTTSLLSTILEESKYDPTFIIGGVVKNLGGHAKVGKGDWLIAEADESDGSFLMLNPIMSTITNIDYDHMDYYQSEKDLVDSFQRFANQVTFYGCCSLNAHDDKLIEISKKMKKPFVFYGLEDASINVDYMAKNLIFSKNKTIYDLYYKDELQTKIELSLPGKHNVLNSLAAISLAHHANLDFKTIAKSIKAFTGVGRRFQKIYNSGDLEIIDDYAHHPTEIMKTLEATKATRPDSKIFVVFQPHRFSRTKLCWREFLHCFNLADNVYMFPLYEAGEKPIPGINSSRLVEDINALHPNLATLISGDKKELKQLFLSNLGEKAIVLVLGAGSIGRLANEIVKDL
jgi:UDP-N-acetylmuramate--alanine ligase